MRLQMCKGTDSIGHGGTEYVVNNHTWQVDVPDHVAAVLLATGAGASRIPEPEPGDLVCPHCNSVIKGVLKKEETV